MNGLLSDFQERLATMVADSVTLIECESPSNDREALEGATECLARLGERLLHTAPERVLSQGRTHLRWSWPGDGPRALVLGHYDTVWPIGSIRSHPAGVESGRLRGPGSFDMKVGVVIALHAVASMHDRGGVTMLLTSDEELGSPTSRDLIESEAREATAVLVLEGAAPGGALKLARAGYASYEIDVEGRSAHAGLDPEKGTNAAVELAHQILRVVALGRPELGTTVTPTLTAAGTSRNTVPAQGTVAVDVRARSVAELARVDAAIRALAPLAGARLQIHRRSERPPMPRSSSSQLFDLARAAASEIGLPELVGVEVGGVSDGNLTAALGTPTLDGLGATGGGAHADDEHAVIAGIPGSTALVRALLDATLAGGIVPPPIDDGASSPNGTVLEGDRQ